MIGGNKGSQQDLSSFLINFNPSEWANQANAHIQSGLSQGLKYSEKYNQQAINAVQAYQQTANNQMQQGFERSQALNAPQRLATYNALDAYQGTLGLPTPAGGSFQLASGMENQLMGQPNSAQQQAQARGFNQGILSPAKNQIGLLAPSGASSSLPRR